MSNPAPAISSSTRPLRRVLIVADESAIWRVAGLRQIDRLMRNLEEFAQAHGAIEIAISWKTDAADLRPAEEFPGLRFVSDLDAFMRDSRPVDLVISTRLFLYRNSLAQLLAASPPVEIDRLHLPNAFFPPPVVVGQPWKYLRDRSEIAACERAFLRDSGKSQDGLVSRHVNRRLSRALTRWLLKSPLTPSVWSVLIFVLPLVASAWFLRGTYSGFIVGCAIFQLYSILDGCDGEIARAKFLQTEFGRRLDSMLDLIGNLLLALTLGIGLARQAHYSLGAGWVYLAEAIVVAVLILLSEGIVFVRRSRPALGTPAQPTKWSGALYQRHHELVERSGLLVFGERFAWWLVQLTKRDMAMLAFLLLALAGWPEMILHLLLVVAGISSALAGNAFLRHPASAVPQAVS